MTQNHTAPYVIWKPAPGGLGVPGTASHLSRGVRLKNLHVVHRTVLGVCFHHAHSIHHPYTLAHSAKNSMLAVQPLRGGQGHKELAAIGIRSCVGHRENPSPSELQVWMKLIFKLFAINRCATSTCPIRRQTMNCPASSQQQPEVKGHFRVQGWERQ